MTLAVKGDLVYLPQNTKCLNAHNPDRTHYLDAPQHGIVLEADEQTDCYKILLHTNQPSSMVWVKKNNCFDKRGRND
jgi:hypothetical protein